MPVEIERWSVVAETEAIAVAGPGALVVSGNDVTYALGSDVVVIVVEGGDRPHGSGVRTAGDPTVLGPFPSVVDERLAGGPRPVLHAFVRLAEGCLALGTVRVTGLGVLHGHLHDLQLYIEAPHPVRPARPGAADRAGA
jgi:hypothetical protein